MKRLGDGFSKVLREFGTLYLASTKQSLYTLPKVLYHSVIYSSSLSKPLSYTTWTSVLSRILSSWFEEAGPIYGKVAQTAMSRVSPVTQQRLESLGVTQVYDRWPAMPYSQVEKILDVEIPGWRDKLKVQAEPIGVASIAQVHEATILNTQDTVVIKIVKPKAKKRLDESVEALRTIVSWLKPLMVTRLARRNLAELQKTLDSIAQETDLSKELKTIEGMHAKLAASKGAKVVRIPSVYKEFSSRSVLTMQRFDGIPLSTIVTGKVSIALSQRKKLARNILKEILIQMFELGLFHADPHAGNLILLEDGSIGLFDWGLKGELSETDRLHIAMLLRAVIALDFDRLCEAIVTMAKDQGQDVALREVQKELKKLHAQFTRPKSETQSKSKLKLKDMFEQSLVAAEKLGLVVPEGLLLMVKSLITVEGLALGIDPEVSLMRVGSPIFWRAAKPGLREWFSLASKIPQLTKKVFSA